jgi:hypothetical protein
MSQEVVFVMNVMTYTYQALRKRYDKQSNLQGSIAQKRL